LPIFLIFLIIYLLRPSINKSIHLSGNIYGIKKFFKGKYTVYFLKFSEIKSITEVSIFLKFAIPNQH